MIRRTLLAVALLALAAACGPSSTEPPFARPATLQTDDDPPPAAPADSPPPPSDTTGRGGGGTIGSGT